MPQACPLDADGAALAALVPHWPLGAERLNGVWGTLLAQSPDRPLLSEQGALDGVTHAPTSPLSRDSSTPWRRADFEALIRHQAQALRSGLKLPADPAVHDEAALSTAVGHSSGAAPIVAWLGLNSAQQLATLFACERLGAIFLPLNWRLAQAELAAVLRHAGTALLLRGTDGDEALDALAGRLQAGLLTDGASASAAFQPGDLMLVYTSGTTGLPKAAVHTSVGMLANARAAIAVQGLNARTRCLAVLPLFHVGGLCIQTLPTLLAGGQLRLHARFEPRAWFEDVAQWRPSTSLLVPATLRALQQHGGWAGADLSSLDFVATGSSVVPIAQIEAFHARAVPVIQVWGSTETGPFSAALRPTQAFPHVGQVGAAAPGVELRLVSLQGEVLTTPGAVGELQVRGLSVMRTYHREAAHPDFVDGWFHSGDLARRDAQGLYEVVGRAKDLIISGGENIYPAEIENLVCGLFEVAECAVIGQPDERWGEVPVLLVVAAPGCAPLNLQHVRASFDTALARFKHPARILEVAALPKTALGKVQKSALQALLARPD